MKYGKKLQKSVWKATNPDDYWNIIVGISDSAV